jgi:carboxylesterase
VTAILVIAVAGVWAWHGWRRRRFERMVSSRLPLGSDGIVPGAQSVQLGRGGRGVLLLHGFGDTPQSLRALAQHLHTEGWTVRVPLLAGHGRSLRALAASRSADWERDARAALGAQRAECHQVCVVGQSMGGSLATLLSTEAPGVASLVLLAPYFRMDRAPACLGYLHVPATPFVPYLRSRNDGSIRDAVARQSALGAGVTSPRLIRELHRLVQRASAVLPRVTVPTLVIHSRHDPRIPVSDAEGAYDMLRATVRELHWLEESAHVVSVDHDRDRVFALVSEWLERASVAPAAGP